MSVVGEATIIYLFREKIIESMDSSTGKMKIERSLLICQVGTLPFKCHGPIYVPTQHDQQGSSA